MKKRIPFLLLILCLLMLTGCGYKETITVKSNGKSDVKLFFYVPVSEASSKGSSGKETINNTAHYKYKTKQSKEDPKKYEAVYYDTSGTKTTASVEPVHTRKSTVIKNNKFVYTFTEAASSVDFYELKVKMPKKIVVTNGKLSSDKKTVTFNLLDYKLNDKLYAYTSKAAAKEDKIGSIELKGLNDNGHLTKAKTLKIVTTERVKTIVVDGKEQTSKSVKITKEGKHTIVVNTLGSSKTFTFYYDKTKPTTSVKSKTYKKKVKITFSDKLSGMKSAKLDGKAINSGKTCKTKGKHTLVLIDKAGNKRTVNFEIKK